MPKMTFPNNNNNTTKWVVEPTQKQVIERRFEVPHNQTENRLAPFQLTLSLTMKKPVVSSI